MDAAGGANHEGRAPGNQHPRTVNASANNNNIGMAMSNHPHRIVYPSPDDNSRPPPIAIATAPRNLAASPHPRPPYYPPGAARHIDQPINASTSQMPHLRNFHSARRSGSFEATALPAVSVPTNPTHAQTIRPATTSASPLLNSLLQPQMVQQGGTLTNSELAELLRVSNQIPASAREDAFQYLFMQRIREKLSQNYTTTPSLPLQQYDYPQQHTGQISAPELAIDYWRSQWQQLQQQQLQTIRAQQHVQMLQDQLAAHRQQRSSGESEENFIRLLLIQKLNQRIEQLRQVRQVRLEQRSADEQKKEATKEDSGDDDVELIGVIRRGKNENGDEESASANQSKASSPLFNQRPNTESEKTQTTKETQGGPKFILTYRNSLGEPENQNDVQLPPIAAKGKSPADAIDTKPVEGRGKEIEAEKIFHPEKRMALKKDDPIMSLNSARLNANLRTIPFTPLRRPKLSNVASPDLAPEKQSAKLADTPGDRTIFRRFGSGRAAEVLASLSTARHLATRSNDTLEKAQPQTCQTNRGNSQAILESTLERAESKNQTASNLSGQTSADSSPEKSAAILINISKEKSVKPSSSNESSIAAEKIEFCNPMIATRKVEHNCDNRLTQGEECTKDTRLDEEIGSKSIMPSAGSSEVINDEHGKRESIPRKKRNKSTLHASQTQVEHANDKQCDKKIESKKIMPSAGTEVITNELGTSEATTLEQRKKSVHHVSQPQVEHAGKKRSIPEPGRKATPYFSTNSQSSVHNNTDALQSTKAMLFNDAAKKTISSKSSMDSSSPAKGESSQSFSPTSCEVLEKATTVNDTSLQSSGATDTLQKENKSKEPMRRKVGSKIAAVDSSRPADTRAAIKKSISSVSKSNKKNIKQVLLKDLSKEQGDPALQAKPSSSQKKTRPTKKRKVPNLKSLPNSSVNQGENSAKKLRDVNESTTEYPEQDHSDQIQENMEKLSADLSLMLNSLKDTNLKHAIEEERDNLELERKDKQQFYETQIEAMENRLAMYTKLEELATQIDAEREKVKGSRGNLKSPVETMALDMIDIALRNYQMLEDTADRLLGL